MRLIQWAADGENWRHQPTVGALMHLSLLLTKSTDVVVVVDCAAVMDKQRERGHCSQKSSNDGRWKDDDEIQGHLQLLQKKNQSGRQRRTSRRKIGSQQYSATKWSLPRLDLGRRLGLRRRH